MKLKNDDREVRQNGNEICTKNGNDLYTMT
jgi:hypothetical protein